MNKDQQRLYGCLLGLAVGDAVGTTVEFKPRGTFPEVTDMCGGGPFNLNPGEWTDDTSMALCLADSLLESDGFDPTDQMKRYYSWFEEGYRSSNGRCFDIGGTVSAALHQFQQTGNPMSGSENPLSAGNGCIMRLAPVVLFYRHQPQSAIHFAGESARTTHGAEECVAACRLLAGWILKAISGQDKKSILAAPHFPLDCEQALPPKIQSIADGDYLSKSRDAIRGSGYVVDCLEAAAWCFANTTSYREAILMAANLGDDADTTAAVCGQLAGAHYGAGGIPAEWLERLALADEIAGLAFQLARSAPSMTA